MVHPLFRTSVRRNRKTTPKGNNFATATESQRVWTFFLEEKELLGPRELDPGLGLLGLRITSFGSGEKIIKYLDDEVSSWLVFQTRDPSAKMRGSLQNTTTSHLM